MVAAIDYNLGAFSYSYSRPNTYETALDYLKDGPGETECWFIAVSGEHKTTLDFMTKLDWKKPSSTE